MNNDKCDLVQATGSKGNIKIKKMEVIDGITIKYHANGATVWSKGKMADEMPEGYWEWYRPDGILKRSGYFDRGEPVGDWITYDSNGKVYKTTNQSKTK